jgi:hypothetical protein
LIFECHTIPINEVHYKTNNRSIVNLQFNRMGVTNGMSGILSFEPKRRYHERDKHKGKFVVIDARNILCKFGIGFLNTGTYIVNEENQNVIEIYICLIVARKYLAEGIIPIFVFDGASTSEDAETLAKRHNKKLKALDHIEQIEIECQSHPGNDENENESESESESKSESESNRE